MSRIAKYDQNCVKCGIAIKPGDIIFKDETHWCKLEACATHSDIQTEADKRRNRELAKKAAQDRDRPLTPPMATTPGQTATTATTPEHQQSTYAKVKLMQFVTKKTSLLHEINLQVFQTLQLMEGQDPNPAKVGQFTKIIYDEWQKEEAN